MPAAYTKRDFFLLWFCEMYLWINLWNRNPHWRFSQIWKSYKTYLSLHAAGRYLKYSIRILPAVYVKCIFEWICEIEIHMENNRYWNKSWHVFGSCRMLCDNTKLKRNLIVTHVKYICVWINETEIHIKNYHRFANLIQCVWILSEDVWKYKLEKNFVVVYIKTILGKKYDELNKLIRTTELN